MDRRFDHGELNIPGRLKGLDREIERNVRAQRAEAARADKASRKEYRALAAEALALVARLSPERLAQLGAPHGLTVIQTRKQMEAAARSRPKMTISALSREFSRAA